MARRGMTQSCNAESWSSVLRRSFAAALQLRWKGFFLVVAHLVLVGWVGGTDSTSNQGGMDEGFAGKLSAGREQGAGWTKSGQNCWSCRCAGAAFNQAGTWYGKIRWKVERALRAKSGKIADPAVMLVVGWVALGCNFKSGWHGRIRWKAECAAVRTGCWLGQVWFCRGAGATLNQAGTWYGRICRKVERALK